MPRMSNVQYVCRRGVTIAVFWENKKHTVRAHAHAESLVSREKFIVGL